METSASFFNLIFFVFAMTAIEKIILFIVLPLLLLLAYSPSMQAPFLFDDIIHIEKNSNIHIKELSCNSLKKAAQGHRPIPMITFALNYYFSGLNPFSFRIFNIFIHFLNSIFVYFVAKKTISLAGKSEKKNLSAISIAIIWSIHPIQIQSVTYIVQRMNILAFFFSLIAIIFYFESKNNSHSIKNYLCISLCLISIVISIYSKQNAAIVPAVIFICEFTFYRNKNQSLLLLTIAFLIILLISFYIYIEHIPDWYSGKNYTPLQRLLTEFRVVVFYILLIIFPSSGRFNIDHDFIMSYSFLKPIGTFYSFVVIVMLTILAVKNRKDYPLFFFGLICFLVTHSIESSIIPLDISFEHRNYAPSFYLTISLISLFDIFIDNKKIYISHIFLIVVILLQISFERNKVWKSGISLWSDSVRKSPNKSRPTESLAYYLEQEGRFEESILYYEKSIFINPNNEKNYHLLGRLYTKTGKFKEAFALYQKGIEVNNGSKEIYNSIGKLMYILKKYEESIFYFKKSIEIDRKYIAPYINMANSLAMIGYTESALESYNTALLYDQEHIDALYNKSLLLVRMNKIHDAEKILEKILKKYPTFADGRNLFEIIQNNKNTNKHERRN
ncbi:MAG: tetratricopeptide repeat protein [Candidatus Electronema sp. VV]